MRGANSVSKSDSVRGRSYGLCEIYVAQTLTFSASCNSKINDTPIWKMKPRLGEEKKKKRCVKVGGTRSGTVLLARARLGAGELTCCILFPVSAATFYESMFY